jgi:hypothetical protein
MLGVSEGREVHLVVYGSVFTVWFGRDGEEGREEDLRDVCCEGGIDPAPSKGLVRERPGNQWWALVCAACRSR